jgi:hypothetical protein
MVFLRQTQLNGFRDELGYPAEVVLVPPSEVRFRMEGAPTHGSVQRLYLHAPGLTLVTLGTACIPQRASPLHVPSLARNLHCNFKRLVGRLSLYNFSRLPLIIPFSSIPPKSFSCIYPPSVIVFTSHGPSQCILNLSECWKYLFS